MAGFANMNQKRIIQWPVFPDGIVIDIDKRQYLTSKVNCLFREKRVFAMDTKGGEKEKPTEIGGLSFLVAGVVLLGMQPRECHFGMLY